MRKKNKKKHWATETKKKKSRWKKINYSRILYYLLTISFVGVVVYAFVFANFLEVDDISIVGTKKISLTEINKTVNDLSAGKYLNLVSRRNFLFFPADKIVRELQSKFKRIERIKIVRKFPRQIKIIVTERKSLLMLCSGGSCYFIDGHGVAYAKVKLNSEEVKQNQTIKLIDESAREVKEGEEIVSPAFVNFILNISGEIEQKTNLKLLNEYRTKSRMSEEIIVQTSKGWDIYINSRIPIKKSARMLKILLNKQLTLREISKLEYVDLRSENKIFYRMKGDAVKEKKEIEKIEKNEKEDEASENNPSILK